MEGQAREKMTDRHGGHAKEKEKPKRTEDCDTTITHTQTKLDF